MRLKNFTAQMERSYHSSKTLVQDGILVFLCWIGPKELELQQSHTGFESKIRNLFIFRVNSDKSIKLATKLVDLTAEEWGWINSLCVILKPFLEATDNLEADKHPTLSFVFPDIVDLTLHMFKYKNIYNTEGKSRELITRSEKTRRILYSCLRSADATVCRTACSCTTGIYFGSSI